MISQKEANDVLCSMARTLIALNKTLRLMIKIRDLRGGRITDDG